MSIGNGPGAPISAVHNIVDTSPREGSGSGSPPRPAHPPAEREASSAATETDLPGPRHVQLPDFPNYELSFRLDKERGRVVIQVIDSKTGTVVRTVPPEDLVRSLRQLPDGRGVLLDREG